MLGKHFSLWCGRGRGRLKAASETEGESERPRERERENKSENKQSFIFKINHFRCARMTTSNATDDKKIEQMSGTIYSPCYNANTGCNVFVKSWAFVCNARASVVWKFKRTALICGQITIRNETLPEARSHSWPK